MSAAEIILIIIGVAIFLLGYLMPARKKDIDEEVQLISEDEVRKMVTGEVEHVKDRINDIVEETVNYSIEKTERAMERVTNEKIMAVNEYSDTVLEEINKNHKEVVFLYDMLNDKHDNLMSTINEATMAADEIKQTAKDAEITAHEASDRIEAVLQTADEAEETIRAAESAAVKVQKAAQDSMRVIINVVESAKSDLAQIRAAMPSRQEIAESMSVTMENREQQQIQKTDKSPEQRRSAGQGNMPAVVNDEIGGDSVLHQENALEPAATERVEQVREPENRFAAEPSIPVRAEAVIGSVKAAGTEDENVPVSAPMPVSSVVPEPAPMPVSGAVPEPAPMSVSGAVPENVPMSVSGVVPESASMPVIGDAQEQQMKDENTEEVEFTPISPRRVEIIHQPDGDYVAESEDDLSTSAAFASMGFFAPKAEESRRLRKTPKRERIQDSVPAVDIQFAQGKDNSRNSNERILELHKAGKSNMAIAKELGLGLGEVKLVIDLFEGM